MILPDSWSLNPLDSDGNLGSGSGCAVAPPGRGCTAGNQLRSAPNEGALHLSSVAEGPLEA